MDESHAPDLEADDDLAAGTSIAPKARQAFAKLRRELTDDELSSPAVQRLLLDDVERLEGEVRNLSGYRDRFHAADKRAAVLEQQLKKSLAGEIVLAVCLAVGAAALGYAPVLWSHQPSGYIALAFGGVLIAGGIASRIVQR